MMRFLPFVLVVAAVACAPGERGFECTKDEDCAAGLLCIAEEAFDPDAPDGEQCVEGQKFCTNPCVDDADCAELDDGLICASQGGVCAGLCFVGSSG